jgi:hypothetical protein
MRAHPTAIVTPGGEHEAKDLLAVAHHLGLTRFSTKLRQNFHLVGSRRPAAEHASIDR